jgi:hypothetical protein
MAQVTGLTTIDGLTIFRVDSDPTTTGGLVGETANPGDIVFLDDNTTGGMWIKTSGDSTAYLIMVDKAYVDSVAGGGGVSWLFTEVDFGNTPQEEASFVINSVGTTPINVVVASLHFSAPTGKDYDELEMDTILVNAQALLGQVQFTVRGLDGPLEGKFKLKYQIT